MKIDRNMDVDMAVDINMSVYFGKISIHQFVFISNITLIHKFKHLKHLLILVTIHNSNYSLNVFIHNMTMLKYCSLVKLLKC